MSEGAYAQLTRHAPPDTAETDRACGRFGGAPTTLPSGPTTTRTLARVFASSRPEPVSNARTTKVLTPVNVQGAPDLVIEIGSPSTRQRDETIKRRLYERSAVSEYWVVDPDIDVVRVYRRTGERFDRAIELSREAGDVLTTDLLPGLDLPLGRIFRD